MPRRRAAPARVALCAAAALHGAAAGYVRQSLAGSGWRVTNANGSVSVPGRVPGSAHEALMAAGVLRGAPGYRFNEREWAWVALDAWTFATDFTADPALLAPGQSALLFFASVDAVATVELNGAALRAEPCAAAAPAECRADDLRTKDAFAAQAFELRAGGAPGGSGGTLRAGPAANTLVVRFESALRYAAAAQAAYPYPVPETSNWNVWAERALDAATNRSHRDFVRKAGSDFGWDWGPAFVPQGLPGDVWIEGFATGHLHADFSVIQTHCSGAGCNGSVMLDVGVEVHSHGDGGTGAVSVSLTTAAGAAVASASRDVSLAAGVTRTTFTIEVPAGAVQLWWPVGYGEAVLYNLSVRFTDGADGSTQASMREVGLRTVELIEDPLPAGPGAPGVTTGNGTSFFFRINGVDVFAKGANWIPAHVFTAQASAGTLAWLLRSAADANMNMIRVWGGGIYQPAEFYELADRMGLMVWQEMMFACAMYPTDAAFLGLVAAEIPAQVARLATHPSIVIWGGNNENEAALVQGWFADINQTTLPLYKADYVKLYVDTVRPALRRMDPEPAVTEVAGGGRSVGGGRPFVDSSPSNGVLSRDPYVKRWGEPNSPEYGDQHWYDYGHDCEDYTTYPMGRFISEHGFQSFPSFDTYAPLTAADGSDWGRNSSFARWRQRHEHGNEQLLTMMQRHLTVPDPTPAGAPLAQRAEEWRYYLYLTQVQQARCYETAFAHWRRLKSTAARTMGILYWQLNDIWAGPSWSSIEHDGSWRLVHNTAKRVYAPLLLSAFIDDTGDEAEAAVHATSDMVDAVSGIVRVELRRWKAAPGEQPAAEWSVPFHTCALCSGSLWSAPVSQLLSLVRARAAECYLHASVWPRVAGPRFEPAMLWLTPPKDAELPPPAVRVVEVRVTAPDAAQLRVAANATAAHVALSVAGVPGRFSDNNFLLQAGDAVDLTFLAVAPFDSAALTSGLSITALR